MATLKIKAGLIDSDGSLNGQLLYSNGTAVYWSNTANNADNLGGTAAASYVQNTDSRTLSGNLVFSGANVVYNAGLKVGANVIANLTNFFVGNSTVNTNISAGSVSVNGAVVANNTGVFATGTVNAASYTVGTTLVANATAIYFGTINATSNGVVVNATSFVVGNSSVNATINSTAFTGTSLSSNNASFLGGTAAASFVQNTDSRTLSGNLNFTGANNNFSGNLTIASTGELIITNGAGIFANGTLGTTGQVLTTNGTSVYWAGASGGFTNGQSISVNNFVLTGAFTANSSNGTAGQILASNASGAYWSNVATLDVYYSNGSLAFSGTGAPAPSVTSTISANSQTFTGNGSNTVYTIVNGFTRDNIVVTLDGLVQIPNTHYSVSGTTLTFTQAPSNNTAIEVRYISSSSVSTGKAIAMAIVFGG